MELQPNTPEMFSHRLQHKKNTRQETSDFRQGSIFSTDGLPHIYVHSAVPRVASGEILSVWHSTTGSNVSPLITPVSGKRSSNVWMQTADHSLMLFLTDLHLGQFVEHLDC